MQVLAHFEAHAPQFVVRYLEHVISKLHSKNPALHNRLLQLYLDQVGAFFKKGAVVYRIPAGLLGAVRLHAPLCKRA